MGRITKVAIHGCDGSHSTVREQLSIAFDQTVYLGYSFMAEVKAEANGIDRTRAHLYFAEFSRIVLLPVPGERHFKIGRSIKRIAKALDAPYTIEDVTAALDLHCSGHVKVESVYSISTYKTRRGLAEKFRAGNGLLCGDAAHVFPPRGGQSMNLGIEDGHTAAKYTARFVSINDESALIPYDSRHETVRKHLEKVDALRQLYSSCPETHPP